MANCICQLGDQICEYLQGLQEEDHKSLPREVHVYFLLSVSEDQPSPQEEGVVGLEDSLKKDKEDKYIH